MNKKSLLLALSLTALMLISACNIKNNNGEAEYNPYECYEGIVQYAKENPFSGVDVQKEFKIFCGPEINKNFEISTNELGYKDSITFAHDGTAYQRVYYPYLLESMDWMKRNIPRDAKVVAWWDYGGMIKMFAERNPVTLSPSEGMLKNTADYRTTKYPKLEDEDKTKKIALILTTNDDKEAVKLMKELNAKYLFIPLDLESKFPTIYEYAYGKFKYIKNDENEGLEDEEFDSNSIVYKASINESFPSFKKIYSDEYSTIFEVNS